MRVFLINNPDVAEEAEGFKEINISSNELSKINRTTLYKSFSLITEINERNFEELCIAFLEGDVDKATKERILNYIGEDKEKLKVFKLYQSLKFKPDQNIRFQSKNILKKHTISAYRKYTIYAASFAAAIIVAILLNFKLNQPVINNIISENNSETIDKTVIISTEVNPIEVKKQKGDLIKRKSKYLEITAVDSNSQKKIEYIRLASIIPLKAEITGISEDVSETLLTNDILSQNTILNKSEFVDDPAITNQLDKKSKQRDNIIFKALKFGIKGISDLTESNIALSTQTDDEGNLTAFALSAGEFEISKKINSKSQKN
jgi:hypothetical protein